jgi:hypothetical protein
MTGEEVVVETEDQLLLTTAREMFVSTAVTQ